jgi:hypothetical protein
MRFRGDSNIIAGMNDKRRACMGARFIALSASHLCFWRTPISNCKDQHKIFHAKWNSEAVSILRTPRAAGYCIPSRGVGDLAMFFEGESPGQLCESDSRRKSAAQCLPTIPFANFCRRQHVGAAATRLDRMELVWIALWRINRSIRRLRELHKEDPRRSRA